MTNSQILERLIEEIDINSSNDTDLKLIKAKCLITASLMNNRCLYEVIDSIDCNSKDYITKMKDLLCFTKTIN